jgi:predicted transcriptional regulator
MPRKKKSQKLREDLHRLVDDLAEKDLVPAKRYLAYLWNTRDPLRQCLMEAPYDDEPLSEEDIAALDEAWEDVRAGRLVPHEEARRRLLGTP